MSEEHLFTALIDLPAYLLLAYLIYQLSEIFKLGAGRLMDNIDRLTDALTAYLSQRRAVMTHIHPGEENDT